MIESSDDRDPAPTSRNAHRYLLPRGLRDQLPPDAEHAATIAARMFALFRQFGYERVEPPLLEFESSLFAGAGAAAAAQTFRLVDPVSHEVMGIRADMTPQIARIAAIRLANAPRPLRLSYGGVALRAQSPELTPERQVFQLGVELIGSDRPNADAEVIALADTVLTALGVHDVSVDLSLPTVARSALDLARTPEERELVRAALDRKDTASVAAADGPAATLAAGLLGVCGAISTAVPRLRALTLPPEAASERQRLEAVLESLRMLTPDLRLTLDPAEHHGFEYQTGLSFTLLSRASQNALGRGGRYRIDGDGEHSTGFSLYLDAISVLLDRSPSSQRLYLPHGVSERAARQYRAQGWATVRGLAPERDPPMEARRLRCDAILRQGCVVPLETVQEK